ncbi:MAG TPA: hypothetical protein VNO50_12685 [Pyrinomonadaceae bacterium]|nr:hypothetical protein [Pyrinomonadaceae bacterium]
MAKITTTQVLEEIAQERELLQQILTDRKYKPLVALEEFYNRNSRLRAAAAGTEPETFGLGVAEIGDWCEQVEKSLLRSAAAQRRILELSEQAKIFDSTLDPARLDEAEAKIEHMEQVMVEITSLNGELLHLLEANHLARQSVVRLKEIGGQLDTLFERAGSDRPIIRRARLRQLWLRSLFVVAAFAGALLAGKAADFISEQLLGRPLTSMGYFISTLLAFVLETVSIGRRLEASQEKLHWEIYENLLRGLDDDLAQIGNSFNRLRLLVNDHPHG